MTPVTECRASDRLSRIRAAGTFAAVSLALNLAWEIAQSPLFASMHRSPFAEALATCLAASLGDVALATLAYLLSGAWRGGLAWMRRPRASNFVVLVSFGLAITVGLELQALAAGRWSYATGMPRVPFLHVGLAPLLQWLLLPPLAVALARRFEARRSGKQ